MRSEQSNHLYLSAVKRFLKNQAVCLVQTHCRIFVMAFVGLLVVFCGDEERGRDSSFEWNEGDVCGDHARIHNGECVCDDGYEWCDWFDETNYNCCPSDVVGECSVGECCDGGNFRSSSYKCQEDVTTEYYCPDGTGCGQD
ncbi:MAG: hypothetical protein JW797_06545, partial [Bradymonadales bacterium]|nr:hypothetical protein [Bradymonadales bacterium]